MGKKGRPNKYEQNVKPRFNDIAEWVQLGATEKEIAKRLHVHKATFIEYKHKYSELNDLIKNNRKVPVEEIKAAMLKRAKGFEYKETKVTTTNIEFNELFKDVLNEVGIKVDEFEKPKLIKTEVSTKYALPDVAAGLVLLQHWDKDEHGKTKWSRDPANLEIKKEELEFKKEQAENDTW